MRNGNVRWLLFGLVVTMLGAGYAFADSIDPTRPYATMTGQGTDQIMITVYLSPTTAIYSVDVVGLAKIPGHTGGGITTYQPSGWKFTPPNADGTGMQWTNPDGLTGNGDRDFYAIDFFIWAGDNLHATVDTPEPCTLVLLATGFLATGLGIRTRIAG